MSELKVRPHATQGVSDQRDGAKAFMHHDVYLKSGLTSGKLCIIQSKDGSGKQIEAVVRPFTKDIGKNIVQLSEKLRKAAGLELGDAVQVRDGGEVPAADIVVMRDVTPDISTVDEKDYAGWKWLIKGRLDAIPYVFPGLELSNLLAVGKRSFTVETVNGSKHKVATICESTKVILSTEGATQTPGKLKVDDVPGMISQLDDLNHFLRIFDIYDEGFPPEKIKPPPSCGVVIQGSSGTGKSMLLDRIAATNWGKVVWVKRRDKASKIQGYFEDAMVRKQQTLILIDNIKEVISKDQDTIEAIEDGLRALTRETLQLGKRPKTVVVATCLNYHDDIPQSLQTDGCFEEYIALSLPDVPARKNIIRYLKPEFAPENLEQYVSDLGDRTHAYTARDLIKLVRKAQSEHLRRVGLASAEQWKDLENPMTWDDVEKAMKAVPPTAMHDVALKPPTVHWDDIGGYNEVKEILQRILSRPAVDRGPVWKRPKGVLLYGPPGCSKTMTAQAMATESGFNFFAIKGGELLNMYVGETERSIRNLFQRAREACPSIIFFDEIDSLAGSRSGGLKNGGVQALTTLLTEMDGFEQRGDVFVLAATNNPEAVDSALLRPGRFDQLVYVDLPDHEARKAILTRKARELLFPPMDFEKLAAATQGFSGAEIAAMCDRAFEKEEGTADVDATAVLERAIERTERGVTGGMLMQFDIWRKSRRNML